MHRILIVDDSATIRKMVRASLQSLEGAEFLEAATGLQAVEQLAVARVRLVVLDLNMPDMHGINVSGSSVATNGTAPPGDRSDYPGRRREPRGGGRGRGHDLYDKAVRAAGNRGDGENAAERPDGDPPRGATGISDPFFEGFLDDYFAECEEHLTAARAGLLELEAAGQNTSAQRRIVNDLFRSFHSLKGISAMVELRPAERLAHEVENALRSMRAGEAAVTPDGINLLIDATQLLEQIVNAHRSKAALPVIEDMMHRIGTGAHAAGPAKASPESVAASDAFRRWTCVFAPTKELLARGIGVDAIRSRLAAVGEIVEAAPRIKPDSTIEFEFVVSAPAATDMKQVLADQPVSVDRVEGPGAGTTALAAATEESDTIGGGGATPTQVVRVDLTRLDELMLQVGDLVISRARLLETLGRIERHVPALEWRTVQENAAAIDRQLRGLREGLMRVRMVPIGEIFRRMPFVVRDLARETGKRVTLLLQGQTTEIDRYLIERMMDPGAPSGP